MAIPAQAGEPRCSYTPSDSLRAEPLPRREPAVLRPDRSGERLDRYLAASLGLSRTAVQRSLRSAAVRIRGIAAVPSASYRLRGNEEIEIDLCARVPAVADPPPAAEPIPLAVIYEDDDLLLIDKPWRLVVHPAYGHRTGTLVNALLGRLPELPGAGTIRPGIVHRLDRETSGLLVVAKTEAARRSLLDQFAARTVEKRYEAVVEGVFPPNPVCCSGNIGRDPRNRRRMAVLARGGRPAFTEFRLLAQHRHAARIECRPRTGRMHQIRVHLASLGHPVVGDPLYGRRRPPAPRLLLHACGLGFVHPRSGARVRFESPLPEEFLTWLRRSDAEGS